MESRTITCGQPTFLTTRLKPARRSQLTVVETTGGTERPILSKVADGDVWELALDILDEASHDRVFVEPNEHDVREPGDPSERGQRVPDHGLWE